jgi:hypothetical protein
MKKRAYLDTTVVNNPFIKRRVRKIVEGAGGYACPEICSPDELTEAIK